MIQQVAEQLIQKVIYLNFRFKRETLRMDPLCEVQGLRYSPNPKGPHYWNIFGLCHSGILRTKRTQSLVRNLEGKDLDSVASTQKRSHKIVVISLKDILAPYILRKH